ncbi:MAG: hypothetical protein M3396_00125 [Actinomycetota bacterium]|nr:hypothetical protein [Actinomycetota bacterium]MDQ3575423.1 hypothetical protein [Actinomycetota bacterium]
MADTAETEQAYNAQLGWAERMGRLSLSLMLVLAVLVILVPTIFAKGDSRVFLLKIASTSLLAFLPGWLYLQFIKNKGQSLYDEYVLNLFRLHIDEYANLPAPPQHTSYYQRWKIEHSRLGTKTKDNLYRKKFEAIYGKSSVSTSSLIYGRQVRDRAETFSPVLFATILFCLGWVLILDPEFYRGIDLFGDLSLSGRLDLPSEALRFGFLGAYSFILQDLIRRYFRDDLKTGAYISAVVRIVFVTLVVTAVDLLWPGASAHEHVFAFLVGFFPQVGLQALQAALAKPLGKLIPSIKANYPLSELEGLNIWYEARLAEEGIEDMQNLASANMVDLLLRSRAPIARLVGWMDQAFLCLCLPRSQSDKRSSSRHQLHALGIKYATDLEQAWKRIQSDDAFRASVGRALGVEAAVAPAVVESMLTSLRGEINLWHVREFKSHAWLAGSEPPRKLAGVAGNDGRPAPAALEKQPVDPPG